MFMWGEKIEGKIPLICRWVRASYSENVKIQVQYFDTIIHQNPLNHA